MKKMSINKFKSINYYNLRFNKIAYECGYVAKQLLGIGLLLNPDHYERIIDDKIREKGICVEGCHTVYIEFRGKKSEAKIKLKELMEERERLLLRYKKIKIIRDIAKKDIILTLKNMENIQLIIKFYFIIRLIQHHVHVRHIEDIVLLP